MVKNLTLKGSYAPSLVSKIISFELSKIFLHFNHNLETEICRSLRFKFSVLSFNWICSVQPLND